MEKKIKFYAKIGDKEMVEILISKGVNDINRGLYGAAWGGHKKLVEFFISKGANDFDAALHGAARGGHKELVEYLKKLKE